MERIIWLISELYSDYIFISLKGVSTWLFIQETGPFGLSPKGPERLVLILISICLITFDTCLMTSLTANWLLMTISNTPPWSICSLNLHVNILVKTSISLLGIRWILKKIENWSLIFPCISCGENIHRFLYWYRIVKPPMRKLINNSCKIRKCNMMCEHD
jgi:hypothetical protein